jgi:hypothetical protein
MVRGSVVLVVAAVLVGVAACGGSSPSGSTTTGNGEASKPPKQILADAVRAANSASSAHMSGYMVDGPGHRVVFDVKFAKGRGAIGSLTFDGLKADIVVIGNWNACPPCKAYLRGSPAFWAYWASGAGISDPSALNGKWLEFSPTDYAASAALEPFVTMADLQGVVEPLTSNMGALTKDATTYKDQSVVALYGPSKVRSVYVAATGTPYPVLVTLKGSSPASVSFDNWGKSVSVTAPSPAVDVSKLGG